MKALYISDIDKKDLEIKQISEFFPNFDANDLRIFTQNSGLCTFAYCQGDIGSIYYPPLGQVFNQIVVGQSLRLFNSAWSEVLFQQLNSFLTSDGTIILPYFSNRASTSKGFWSLTDLECLFKQKGRPLNKILNKETYVEFSKASSLAVRDSTLTWYFQDYASLIIDTLVYNNSLIKFERNAINELCMEILLPCQSLRIAERTAEPISSTNPREFREGFDMERCTIDLGDSLQSILKAQAYYVGGISYKGSIVGGIISKYFPKNRKLSFLDQGGGSGLLTCELLLNQDLNIYKGVNCDISQNNLLMAYRLFCFYRHKLRGKFFFNLCASQDFNYDDKYDVISFIGSLLYVPRNKTLTTLKKSWDALKLGGILIIHENIKASSYKRDYDVMFTVDELEGLLSSFGLIDYYSSTTNAQISQELVGSKTVFRVIQKSK